MPKRVGSQRMIGLKCKEESMKKCFILIFLFLYNVFVNSAQEILNSWPCTYLDPEIVYKINEKEIKTIVEIGSNDGLDAIQLSCHYECPVFVFANNTKSLSKIKETISSYPQVTVVPSEQDAVQLGDWMKNENIATIDLLCIHGSTDCFNILQNAENCLGSIKYILISNEPLLYKSKEYLKARGFRSYFDGIGLFKHVLFINPCMDISKPDPLFIEVFNTPVPSPLVPNNINSILMYEAIKGDHSVFHEVPTDERLDINYQDSNGNTALMLAIANDRQYPAKKILQHPKLDLAVQNKNGCTALMIATLRKNTILEFLLEDPRCLATIDIANNLGMTPQETAELLRLEDIVELLNVKKMKHLQTTSVEYADKIIPEKALICGICKDVAQFLSDEIRIFEKIGALFEEYRIIIYENNSTDKTQHILREWMKRNSKIRIQFECLTPTELEQIIINTEENGALNRIEKIARARNKLLDMVMAPEYDAYDNVIMMDMDFASAPNIAGILEVFQSKREWDAVFGYGIGRKREYWDWYAFRDYNQPFGPELLGHDWFSQKMWSLKKTDQWCPVYSAFGGIGIYKRASIEGCRYSALITDDLEKVTKQIIDQYKPLNHPVISKYCNDIANLNSTIQILNPQLNLPKIKDPYTGILINDDPEALVWRMNSFTYQYPIVCEHVPFHASMITKGKGKLFINPRLVLTYTR